jgi:flagellin
MISIQTNIDSLVAQQNLSVNNMFQSNTIQQLTSGYRINSSADDAAGLSVANGYRNQIAELNQGVLNANQGVSELQIVDGGLSNISQMLDRLQTLATESASQTFTGNRDTLNNEYQGLLSEIGRQANNVGLGDTNTANKSDIQVYIGGGQSAQSNSSVGVNLSASSVSATGLGLLGTSVLTTAPVVLGGANAIAATAIQALNTDTFTVATAASTNVFTIYGQTGDTVQGQVQQLNSDLNTLGISASLNQSGQLQFQSSNAFSINAVAGGAVPANDLVSAAANTSVANNTGLNSVGISTATTGDVLSITVGSSTANYAFGATPGTQADVTGINQALQAQGITGVTAVLDVTADTAVDQISLQGASNFTATVASATPLLTQPTTVLDNKASAVSGAASPSAAINAIAQAVQTLGTVQGIVGAGENTLNYAINLAQSQITSFSSAQSQIRDANVAAEAADLTKAQVLQQASIAAMAQANQEPQAILSLLKT